MSMYSARQLAKRKQLLQARAHGMRQSLSPAEARLWHVIRAQQLGVQFRRQVVLTDRYIADFLAPGAPDRRGGRRATRFLRSGIRVAGRAPKHLITDRGVQFPAEYRAWCERLDIKPRWGAVGSHRSIAVIERFWHSSKAECCSPILVPLRLSAFQAELDIYATWFRYHRPHRALGGRTPEESSAEKPPSVRRFEPRPNMPIRGDPDSVRRVSSVELRVSPFAGKKHLPIVELQAA